MIMEALMKMIQRLMFEVLSSRQRCHVGRRSHDSELRDKNPRPKDDSKRSKYYWGRAAFKDSGAP